ncbi:MAG: hypothetical protein SCH70_03860 [Candidatus Methanoperedens sp.]|nr:hypothetical protein [Candidatus Methanoperedens sp.]
MKTKIVKVLAVFLILSGMVGIAAANPCPNPDTWDGKPVSYNIVVLDEDLGGNNWKYYVRSAENMNSTDGIPGFREVCIANENAPDGAEALWDGWGYKITNQNVTEFDGSSGEPGAAGNPYNIPFSGIAIPVGTIQFSEPPNVKTLVHVISKEICGGTDEDPGTCFVRPAKPTIPVPELNSVILVLAGLLGLGLVGRKYKR